MSLRERLQERANKLGRPVQVGLVGAGQMGTGLLSQMEKMAGMRVMACADVLPGRARAAYQEGSVDPALVAPDTDDVEVAADAIAAGRRVATTNADWLVSIPNLDVILECTGVPEVGARVCAAAIEAGKNTVNMNVETDATIGYILAKKAQEKGVVYTLVAGDEPGTIKEMYDFAEALGFEIVTVGKGKNNPLDRTANPDSCAPKAKAANMSAKMLASFVDGTKTMVEMTSIGNGTGYAPEKAGAYGPQCTVKDLANVFIPKADGGIFERRGAVDYAVGDVAPGVFVIITTDQPKIINDLNYLRLNGNGKYWALYRPYHLANLECPITVAKAALDGEVTLQTNRVPVAETVACAKRDLAPGEKLDSLGGFTMYGLIDRAEVARAEGLLPLGLAVGATVVRPVKAGQPIRYDDVALVEGQTILKLRRAQDALVA
ncbi:MAG: NAD(P)-dependent oxidoreductase [Anaerolineales bacterium]|nr:NAD(P)-dependent oxidoreductase [Anaerolineales bacterium]